MDNTHISKHLGKASEYKSTYDASLLVREPRASNRVHLNIDNAKLPFVGYDTWNAYEVSCLTTGGQPVTAIAKLVYNCNSEYIVESKSLKLYLNTFNMTKLEATPALSLAKMTKMIQEDLTALLITPVEVSLATNKDTIKHNSKSNSIITWQIHESQLYKTLEDTINVECSVYSETPKLLQIENSVEDFRCYHSSLLKSNCRVTQQPDWGDVYIYLKGKKTVTEESLLKYIISFRDECHFHEEICETIYVRLSNLLSPDELFVRCLYARRGGIDINPQRASSEDQLDKTLKDCNKIHTKTPKQ